MKLIPLIAIGYSHGILPTVTIIRDGTHVRINEADFDPDTMTLAEAPETDAAPTDEPDAPPPPAAPAQLIVMKQGRKFFIADTMGQKVEGEAAVAIGVNDAGYGTEADAQAALAAIAPQA